MFKAADLAAMKVDQLQTQAYRNFVASANFALPGNVQVGLAGPIYDAIYQMITDIVVKPTRNGPTSVATPKADVDFGSWVWISGAKEVNAVDGFQGRFIQEWTKAQYVLRGGQEDPVLVAQKASNEIGAGVIDDIFKQATPNLPTIESVGVIDAAAVAKTVYRE